ncbi:flagellar filament capping protein FliD [Spirochaeta isovalerica]|uniref:Flagellar hook-associated protein 2 n=1 Tax=Spirochaeta isovalerica TaxID=150 RepID=A0A841R4G0_9SPIO|nr:flagellar filament capping protein FliD [Spirochaeta isovalerica]MBB6478696.1 flagellar hook-associated protein 2 [Spirochaeta isovalerica]
MSDIKIPGVNSDTTLMVEKLMEVERIPLKKLESDLDQIKESKQVWQSLGRTTGELQSATKSLYGFQNPFSEHIATSSKPDILTASASRNAIVEDIELFVKQKASGDRFLSKDLPRDFRVPAGTYSFLIGDEEVSLRYRGGKLEDFARRLNEKDETLLRASVIRNRADSQVLLVESMKTGLSNSLFFQEDAIQFGLDSGLIRQAKGESGEISISASNTKDWEKENNGKFQITDGGIVVKSGASLALPFNAPLKIEDGAVLEIEYSVNLISEDEYKTAPPPGPSVPEVPGITYRGITVESSGYSFAEPEIRSPEPPPHINDMNVFFSNTEKGINPLPEIQDNETRTKVTVPLSASDGSFQSLNIRNNNNYREITLYSAKISNPSRRGDYEPVNPLDRASDAVLEMNGIEVVRDSNTIDDLVTGLTLNVHSSGDEKIDLKIEPDTELAKDQLINFVYRYNELITRLAILTNSDSTNTAIVDEKENYSDDEREEAISQLGMFRGEYSLVRLKNAMQTIVSSPYETIAGPELTLLKQLGISTNETGSGAATDMSRLRGYLEINEETLDQALKENQGAIRDLFGMDTDGDLIIDSGIAKKLDEQLTAYTQTGGFYSTKISRIDYDIENKNDDISDYKDRLASYEESLKRKYGNMEAMLNQLEASGNSIDNFNNQNSNNN